MDANGQLLSYDLAGGDPMGDRVIICARISPSDERASEVTWSVGRRPGPRWTIYCNLPSGYDVCNA